MSHHALVTSLWWHNWGEVIAGPVPPQVCPDSNPTTLQTMGHCHTLTPTCSSPPRRQLLSLRMHRYHMQHVAGERQHPSGRRQRDIFVSLTASSHKKKSTTVVFRCQFQHLQQRCGWLLLYGPLGALSCSAQLRDHGAILAGHWFCYHSTRSTRRQNRSVYING